MSIRGGICAVRERNCVRHRIGAERARFVGVVCLNSRGKTWRRTREIRRGAVLEVAWRNMARNRAADGRRLQVHGREGWLSPARNAVIWLYAKYAEKYLGETGWEDI